MSENRFIEKFQNKTDSELENILKNKNKFDEKAVSASIHILKERNGKSLEIETIENEIEIEKEKKITTNKKIKEEEKKENNITDDPNAPELHSKKVIRVFSILFSTIFGAVLLMYNMKKTDNKTGRTIVLVFGVLYTTITIIAVNLLNMGSNITFLFNIIGGSILTEYFWNRYIGKELEHRKRNWIKPAIISVLITTPFVLAAIYGQ